MQKSRTPLTLGWEAARANAVPALIIQAFMLALLVAYYTSHTAAEVLSQLAEFKRSHGILFVIVASITAGALIPELFLIIFFQRCRPTLRNVRNLLFTIPVWGFDGTLATAVHTGSLSREDYSNAAGDMGGLDSADGDHLFIAPRTPISALRACPFVLGPAFDLHDQPLCGED